MHKDLRIAWLVRLRWIVVIVEALLLAGTALLPQLEVDLAGLAGVLAFAAVSNAALHLYFRRATNVPDILVPATLALDIGLVTLGLWLSGGPMNPFSFLYVVYVAVAAVLAAGLWRWLLLALAVGGYGLLYVLSPASHHGDAMMLHLQGMWVAMAVTAGLIIYFVSMLQRALSERDRQLATFRANEQRVASLTAMAAGAAHELATPLSTIAVTGKELEYQLRQRDDDLAEDAQIIRSQVARCRHVLDRMASDAGQGRGEALQSTDVSELLQRAIDSLADASRVQIAAATDEAVNVPPEAFVEVLASLLQNALDASDDDQTVEMGAALSDDGVRFSVKDSGIGMTRDELRHATEPFFTTKDSSARMGLGLYVAQQLTLELGGELQLDSRPDEGCLVEIWIPRDRHAPHEGPRSADGATETRDVR